MKRSSIYLFLTLLMVGCGQYDEANEATGSKSATEQMRVYAHKEHNQSEPTTRSVSLDEKKGQIGQTIKIKFLSSAPALQEKVEAVANRWLQHANLKFEYVTSGSADVRITFCGLRYEHNFESPKLMN